MAVVDARCLGRDVQRDLRGRDRADGPRGDAQPAQSPGHLRAQCRHRDQDPRASGARSSTCSPGSTASISARPPRCGPAAPYIRPYGAEWIASEDALTRPIAGINPTMITRAGALDQGNLILNLQDVESKGIAQNVLFLAGSAINSIKGKDGKTDPRIGLEAHAPGDRGPPLGRARRIPRWTST